MVALLSDCYIESDICCYMFYILNPKCAQLMRIRGEIPWPAISLACAEFFFGNNRDVYLSVLAASLQTY